MDFEGDHGPPSPLWGGTGRVAARVGKYAETRDIVESSHFPTLTPSASVPPHKGEGGGSTRRATQLILCQALLFACGAGVLLAWQAGLYACAIVMVLTAALGATAVVSMARRPAPTRLAPSPEPDVGHVQQHLLESLIDQTPAPLLMLHPDGVIEVGNRAARTLFRAEDRIVGPPTALADVLAKGTPGERLTVSLETPAGPHTYAVSVTDITGPSGAMRLAALLDIQPEIRATEAAAARDLLQVLSHEIMNGLTPVASLATTAGELLADETPVSLEQARDAVATLARRAEGLTRFVDAYRALARLPSPIPRPVGATALIEEVARLFRGRWDARGVRLEVMTPSPDIVVKLDMDLMVHALLNILANGAEAALGGVQAAPLVSLTAEPRSGGVSIIAEDNGPGVARPDAERIFRPFFTTKPHGTGVGLSFARQVALSHGGDLTLVAARKFEGAAFLLSI